MISCAHLFVARSRNRGRVIRDGLAPAHAEAPAGSRERGRASLARQLSQSRRWCWRKLVSTFRAFPLDLTIKKVSLDIERFREANLITLRYRVPEYGSYATATS